MEGNHLLVRSPYDYGILIYPPLMLVGAEKQESKGKASEASKEQQVPPGVGGAVGGAGAVAAGGGGVKRPGQFASDKQPDPKRKRT